MLDIYSKKLIGEGVATQDEVQAVVDKYDKICEEAYRKASEETQVTYFGILLGLHLISFMHRYSISTGLTPHGLDSLRVKIL